MTLIRLHSSYKNRIKKSEILKNFPYLENRSYEIISAGTQILWKNNNVLIFNYQMDIVENCKNQYGREYKKRQNIKSKKSYLYFEDTQNMIEKVDDPADFKGYFQWSLENCERYGFYTESVSGKFLTLEEILGRKRKSATGRPLRESVSYMPFQKVSKKEADAIRKAYLPNEITASRSEYYYIDGYLYRYSNHFGRVRHCLWFLNGKEHNEDYVMAKCKFSELLPLSRPSNDKLNTMVDITYLKKTSSGKFIVREKKGMLTKLNGEYRIGKIKIDYNLIIRAFSI